MFTHWRRSNALQRLLLLFVVAAPVGAQNPNQQISARLESKFDLSFTNHPLPEVLRILSQQAQVSIVVDQPAFQREWIDAETMECSWQSGDSTAKEVLDHVLAEHRLTWMARHGVIWITTQSACNEFYLQTRVYRITQPISAERRARSIRTTVARDSWNVVGGPGDLSPLEPNFIAIRQTPAIHRKIVNVFRKSIEPVENLKVVDVEAADAETTAIPAALKEALQQPVAIKCQSLPVFTVLEILKTSTGCEILVDRDALQDSQMDGDHLMVSLEIHQVPFASALTLLLESAHPELCWSAGSGSIKVTSNRVMNQLPTTRTYDLRPIIDRVDEHRLMEAIEYTVHPQTWQFGGGDGMMELSADGQLVVEQTHNVHASLWRFLADLEAGVGRLPPTSLQPDAD